MKRRDTTILYALCIILFSSIFLSLIWVNESSKHKTRNRIVSGLKYKVNKKTYQVPNLSVTGEAYVLEEEFLLLIRKLYSKTKNALDGMRMKHWVSGGTLLGFIRHKTFMPWDDDIDFHTEDKNREYMFSKEFRDKLKEKGLEAIYMLGTTPEYTFYKGGVRIKLIDYENPVLDIFFVKEDEGKIKKIENWNKQKIDYNDKETWNPHVIYPIQQKSIDGLKVNMPNKPITVLKKQYGPNVLKSIHCGALPHSVAYDMFNFIWVSEP